MKRLTLDPKIKKPALYRSARLVAVIFSMGAFTPFLAAYATDHHLEGAGSSSNLLAQSTTTDADPTLDPEQTSTSSPDPQGSQSTTRFSCQIENGEYTVMYLPESQPGESYPWASPGDMGGGWSAERRCIEISRRLEEYRPDGLLELRTDVENGYDTVCATTQQSSSCRIVFTVPEGQDPTLTRDRVFENLAVANSGQSTEAVNTFTGDEGLQILDTLSRDLGINLPSIPGARTTRTQSSGINLRPFLDPADGGTGTQLRSSNPVLLNPDDFR